MRRIKVSPTDEDLRPTEFVLQLGLTKRLRKNMTKIKERKKKNTRMGHVQIFTSRVVGSASGSTFHPDGTRRQRLGLTLIH
jgi:hypothetical protein